MCGLARVYPRQAKAAGHGDIHQAAPSSVCLGARSHSCHQECLKGAAGSHVLNENHIDHDQEGRPYVDRLPPEGLHFVVEHLTLKHKAEQEAEETQANPRSWLSTQRGTGQDYGALGCTPARRSNSSTPTSPQIRHHINLQQDFYQNL